MIEKFTIDNFLNGKIKLKQLLSGYRATSDAILLASSLRPEKNQTVLDVGAGTGAVSLALAAASDAIITGLEIQMDLLKLANENAKLNQMQKKVSFMLGDIANPPRKIIDSSYDFVVTNPPYYTETFIPPNKNKAIAHHENNIPLPLWIDFCLRRIKPYGSFSMIHRADRLQEILNIISSRLGALKIVPLWPMYGKNPKRIIITGIKNSAAPLEILPGLILHTSKGNYTKKAQNILRNGQCLWQNLEN